MKILEHSTKGSIDTSLLFTPKVDRTQVPEHQSDLSPDTVIHSDKKPDYVSEIQTDYVVVTPNDNVVVTPNDTVEVTPNDTIELFASAVSDVPNIHENLANVIPETIGEVNLLKSTISDEFVKEELVEDENYNNQGYMTKVFRV